MEVTGYVEAISCAWGLHGYNNWTGKKVTIYTFNHTTTSEKIEAGKLNCPLNGTLYSHGDKIQFKCTWGKFVSKYFYET